MTAVAGGLPAMAIASRLEQLRERVAGQELDALVVSGRANVRYLTGFSGSAGTLLLLPGGTVLLTDGRYETQAAEQLAASGVDARVEVAPAARQAQVAAGLVTPEVGVVGLEAAHVSWATQQAMAAQWFPDVELVATVGVVEGLRRVKDEGEIARIARAATIADEALAALRAELDGAPTEREFALALEVEMSRRGADGPSFETIVASGPNSAKPHHRPSNRPIAPGEPVVVDFGAKVDGYCSDMTRTVWVDELAPSMRPVLAAVAASQAAGVAAVAAGVEASAVDRACRRVIGDAGWADRFVHGTGHGVGLDIHEAPSVASTSLDTLREGHVVTVEPGVYLPGLGGVRIEDTVVVTEAGCYPLTTAPKDHSD
ncbi:MAG TPA: aminopeptidase P family protein [Acidimicrobiales bacterium]|nr:aminopeptidase P family protein [Acidimicrobiales bacterium]